MALIGINPVAPREKESKLDKVLKIAQLTEAVTGMAFKIPESLAQASKYKAETSVLRAKAEPLTLEEQRTFVDQGLPPNLVPKTRGEVEDAAKLVFETPAQKSSRLKTEGMLEILAMGEKRAQRQEGREGQKFDREMSKPVLTPAEESVDKKFATTYEDWNAQGGSATANKNLNQARWAMKELVDAQKNRKNYSGKDVGSLGIAGQEAKALLASDAASMEEQVQQIVTSNLRQALGAQFTENEGKRIMRQTFNPMLDEKENARRLGGLIKELEAIYDSKRRASEFYELNGTLKGFKGSLKDSIIMAPDKHDAENF